MATGIAFQCFITGFAAGSLRYQLKVPYPDSGSGIYAAKLNEADWVKFNSYQRCHMNYVEGLPLVLMLELVGGLFYPRLSAALGAVYLFGRTLYTRGYQKHGPEGRKIGALILDTALLGMLGTVVYGSLKLLKYVK